MVNSIMKERSSRYFIQLAVEIYLKMTVIVHDVQVLFTYDSLRIMLIFMCMTGQA